MSEHGQGLPPRVPHQSQAGEVPHPPRQPQTEAGPAFSRPTAQPSGEPSVGVPKDPIRSSQPIEARAVPTREASTPSAPKQTQTSAEKSPAKSKAERNFGPNQKKALAFLAGTAMLFGGVLGYNALDSDGSDGNGIDTTRNEDDVFDSGSAIERTIIDERGRQIDVLKPGVVGEGACGPKVDPEVIQARMTEGLPVVKPSETAAFFDKYPQMEKEFNDFYNENYGEDLLEYIFTKPVLNAEVLGDVADEDSSVARRMTARMEALTLDSTVDVQNHYCDPETGEIFEVNNINRLQEGEQVWAIPLTAGDIKNLLEDGVTIPEELVTLVVEDDQEYENAEDEVVRAILVQRLACNNPLLERDDDITTTTTTIPGISSSTTSSTTSSTSSTTTITIPDKVPVTIVENAPDEDVEEPELQEDPTPTTNNDSTSSTTSTVPPNTIESTTSTQPPKPTLP